MTEWSTRDLVDNSPIAITKTLEKMKITRLGMNVYETKVTGIPDGRIEWYLWYRGKCIVWKHDLLGWVVTDMSEIGWDINGFPNKWRPVFETNVNDISIPAALTEADDCIAFYDTTDYRFKRSDILAMCTDYADVRETIRTQIYNQKTPMLAVCADPKIKSKLKNFFVDLTRNAKILFIDRDIKNSVETLDLNPVYNVESLYQYSKALESEMFEYCGIDSKDAYQKKERLIVDEQEGNDEELNYLLADGLKSRQASIDKCRSKGLTASTEIQKLVRPIAEEEMLGDDDGETEQI